MKNKQLILLGICLLFGITALSECIPQKTIEEEWENTPYIFIGTAIDEINSPIHNLIGQSVAYYNIVIDKVFKGNISVGDTVTMFKYTIEHYKFCKNNQYIIFANNRGGFLSTTVCQRTCAIENAHEILRFLENKPKEELENELEYEEYIFAYEKNYSDSKLK